MKALVLLKDTPPDVMLLPFVPDESTTRSRGLTTNRSMTSRHGTLQGPIPVEENSVTELSGRSGSRQNGTERAPQDLLNHWMLPASWVPKVAITREAFDTRCGLLNNPTDSEYVLEVLTSFVLLGKQG